MVGFFAPIWEYRHTNRHVREHERKEKQMVRAITKPKRTERDIRFGSLTDRMRSNVPLDVPLARAGIPRIEIKHNIYILLRIEHASACGYPATKPTGVRRSGRRREPKPAKVAYAMRGRQRCR